MHSLEPFYGWLNYYNSEEDPLSPFFEAEHSEFYFQDKIYNHYIHPQWDNMGSQTLYLRVLYADYDIGYGIIELIGEWNDLLYNDIMYLKREIADRMIDEGIDKFILIADNVLNFHASEEDYYEEWFEDVENGWIAILNLREHVIDEFVDANIDSYFLSGGQLNDFSWRTHNPSELFSKIESQVLQRIG